MSAATSLPPASDLRVDALTDAELVLRARQGDSAAADALVARHLDTVRAVCRSRLSSPHDVNDAVQDTFVRALSKLDRIRDPERVAPWLRAIASRVCVDQYRATRHVVVVPSPGAEHADLGRGPEDHAVGTDAAQSLHLKLATLSQRDRRALWLRDAHDLPVGDVARDLGVTEGSARVLLTRARHRLRASYQGLAGLAIGAWIRLRDRLAGWDSGSGIDVRTAAVAQAVVAAAIVVSVLPSTRVADTPESDDVTGVAVAESSAVPRAFVADPAPGIAAREAASTASAPSVEGRGTATTPERPTTAVTAGPATVSKGAPPADAQPAARVEAGGPDQPVGEALVYVGDVLGGGEPAEPHDEPTGPTGGIGPEGQSDADGGLLGQVVRVGP